MAAEVDGLLVRIEASTALLRQQMAAAERNVEQATRSMDRSLSAVDRALERVGHVAGRVQGALAAIGAGALLGQIVSTSAEFQKLEATLKTVTGSAEAASAAFADIKAFAATTPYDVQQVTNAFIKLKALGLDASMESLKSYGNTASAMGKDLIQFIEAVADAATGENERLKEFGITADKEGGKVKFTFQGVTTAVQASAASIQKYLLDIGRTKFAGAMDEQATTLGGALSNLQDSVQGLMDRIGRGGFADAVEAAARALSEAASASDGAAASLGGMLGSAVETTTDAVRALWEHADLLQAAFVAFATARVVTGIAAIGAAAVATTASVGGLSAALLANPIGFVAAALGGLAATYSYVRSQQDEAAEGARRYNDLINGTPSLLDRATNASITQTKQLYEEAIGRRDLIASLLDERQARLDLQRSTLVGGFGPDDERIAYLDGLMSEGEFKDRFGSDEAFQNIRTLKRETDDLTKAWTENDLAAQILAETHEILSRRTVETGGSTTTATESTKKATDAVKKAREAVDEQIERIVDERLQLDMTDRQRAIHNAALEAERTMRGHLSKIEMAEYLYQVETETGLLYDSTKAHEAKQKAQDAAAQAAQRLAEEQARIIPDMFDRAFDRAGDAVVDMVVRGENALRSLKNLGQGVAASLLSDFMQFGVVNPFRNLIGLGASPGMPAATLWGASMPMAGSNLMGSAGNMALNYAGSSLFSGSTINGIGASLGFAAAPSAVIPGSAAAAAAANTINPATGSLAAYNSWGAAGAQSSGSLFGTTTLGGALGAAGMGFGIGMLPGLFGANKGTSAVIGGIGGGVAGGALAGTAIMPGIGTVAGAAIGAIAGILGGVLGGKIKPSDKTGTATLDLATGGVSVGGLDGKKFDQANRDAAEAIATSIAPLLRSLEQVSGGEIGGAPLTIGVGNRDGIYVQRGSERTEFDRSEAGTVELLRHVTETFMGELGGGIPEALRLAVENSKATDAGGFAADLTFGAGWEDSIKALSDALGLEDTVRQQAIAAVQETVTALEDFRSKTAELGLDTGKAEEATRSYLERLLTSADPKTYSAVEAAIVGVNAKFEELQRAAEEFGIANAADLAATGRMAELEESLLALAQSGQTTVDALEDAKTAFPEAAAAIGKAVEAINDRVAEVVTRGGWAVERAINPDWRPTGADVLLDAGLGSADLPDFTAALDGFLKSAATAADLREIYAKLNEELRSGAIPSADQYNTILASLTQRYADAAEAEQEQLKEAKQLQEDLADAERERLQEAQRLQEEIGEERARQLEDEHDRIREMASFGRNVGSDIGSYLSGLRAGSDGGRSYPERLASSRQDFVGQLSIINSANSTAAQVQDALRNITSYAEQYRKTLEDGEASGLDYKAGLSFIEAALSNLPMVKSDTDRLIDAIAAQPAIMATAIGAEFGNLDLNGDLTLSLDELGRALGEQASESTLQAVLRELDINGDGQLTRLEALRLAVASSPASISTLLSSSLNLLNSSVRGVLTASQLKAGLAGLATDAQISEVITALDTNKDGVVTAIEAAGASTGNLPTLFAAAIAGEFNSVDINKDLALSIDELRQALGEQASEDTLRAVLDQLDVNGDGQVSQLEAIGRNTGLSGPLAKQTALNGFFEGLWGEPGNSYMKQLLEALTKQDVVDSGRVWNSVFNNQIQDAAEDGVGGANNKSRAKAVDSFFGGDWQEYLETYKVQIYNNTGGMFSDLSKLFTTTLGFDEQRYLALNPEVAASVKKGEFKSGLQHFLLHGLAEGRKFADGGYHHGGLRLVGERGWEVEATGPARIWNQEQLGKAIMAANDWTPPAPTVPAFSRSSFSPAEKMQGLELRLDALTDENRQLRRELGQAMSRLINATDGTTEEVAGLRSDRKRNPAPVAQRRTVHG